MITVSQVNKRYYWLRLQNDFFNQKEIKKLRTIAGGDTYTIIYLKMALLSITNGGKLYYDNIENDFAAEIALELNEDVENVRITINYLQSVGLLEYIETDEMLLTDVPTMIGSETASTRRSRKSRSQKALQCNTVATICNGEIEKEKELELEKEEEVNSSKEKYQLIADMYNDTCVSFPPVKILSHKRKSTITRQLKRYTVDDFKILFKKAEASSFLKGANDRNWTANFDWLIEDCNMVKVLEGCYDNRPPKNKTTKFSNFTQRDYDMDAMERMLNNSQNPPPTAGTDESIRQRAEALRKEFNK